MRRTCIGIYGGEGEYVRKLAGYIRRRCGDGLEVKAFTRKEALRECLEAGGLDCVLTETDGEAICAEYGVWTAFLSEGASAGAKADGIYIDKYQSAEQIWRLLLKFGGERLKGAGTPLAAADAAPVFIGIASPLHGLWGSRMRRRSFQSFIITIARESFPGSESSRPCAAGEKRNILRRCGSRRICTGTETPMKQVFSGRWPWRALTGTWYWISAAACAERGSSLDCAAESTCRNKMRRETLCA